MAQAAQDPRNLHQMAVDVQTDLHKLAVGLAHAGADPKAVAQLTQMSGIIGQVVKVLGEGPPIDGGQAQPSPAQPEPPAAPEQAGPPEQAPGPPQAAPAGPGEQPGSSQEVAAHSMHSATHALHAMMIASKQRQGQ